jgi:hypothetical protein
LDHILFCIVAACVRFGRTGVLDAVYEPFKAQQGFPYVARFLHGCS